MTLLLSASMMFQQGGAAQNPASPFGMLVPFVVIFAVFYFLIIRPQSKRQKQHRELIKSLEKGIDVVTSGGIHGRIHQVSDESEVITLEIADKVRIKVNRSSISKVVEKK